MDQPIVTLISVVVILLIAWYWLRAFVEMMLLSEADLPGRHDKALWTAVFIFVFPLAPLAFSWWKSAYLQVGAQEKSPPDQS